MKARYVLRVALLWNGTVMEERTLATPSERRLTVGESRRADFVVPAPGIPGRAALFERAEFGYALNGVPGLRGTLVKPGKVVRFEGGGGARYVTPGDWGVLELGPVEIFFQFVERARRPKRWRLLPRFNGPLITAVWFSLVIQLLVVMTARLIG